MSEEAVAASELENVIAVFGAVDLAVQADTSGATRERVSGLIPAYAAPETHWYSVMSQWAVDRDVKLPVSISDPHESVAEPLGALTKTKPGTRRLAARRLLGLYAATQAVPETFAPGGSHGSLVTGSLSELLRHRLQPGEPPGKPDQAAGHLHEFMAGDHPPPAEQSPDERWTALIEKVRQHADVSGLEESVCTGRLVERPEDEGPVTTLLSAYDVPDVTFEKAVKILAPENWPRCMTFWRCMKPYDAPPHRYYEEVTTNRKDPDSAFFTARAILDFTFGSYGNAQMTHYDLAPVKQPRDGLLVDRGSLVVHQLPGRLRITTTKRLKFKGPLSGEGLSLVACIFGWTEMGMRMMYNCAHLPSAELRHVPPREDGGSRRRAPREAAVTARIAQQTAETIKDSIDDQVAYVQDWADRVADDEYGYVEMADDMARAGVRMITDSARIMDVAVRNARTGSAGARAPRARPAPTAESSDHEEPPS